MLLRASLFALLAAALAPFAASQTIYHVDDDAPPNGDGLSWATAFDTLDAALAIATVGDDVWVAIGRYWPSSLADPGDPRSATFLVPQAVGVFGGFDGTETLFSQRAGLYEQTHLSGDIGVAGNHSDNAYHVVTVNHPNGIPPGAVDIDGVLISHGNAVGALGGNGAGIHCFNSGLRLARVTIENCFATRGAGIHAQPGSVRMKWCHFSNNVATDKGGALWSHAANLKIYNCIFDGNETTADDSKGGAIYLHSSANTIAGQVGIITFANSLFYGNRSNKGGAGFMGGGMFSSGKADWINCTFVSNHANEGGGALWASTNTLIPALSKVRNCIVWENTAPMGAQLHGRMVVTRSVVMNGTKFGPDNLTDDPMFVDEAAHDYRLRPDSPAIDAGRNGHVTGDWADVDDDGVGGLGEVVPLDLDGAQRQIDDPLVPDTGFGVGPIIDLGAYEL